MEHATAATPDVLVIGAGLTGAMIAAQLAEKGARVGVVDAQHVGGGATSRALGTATPDPSSAHFAETARGVDLLRGTADRHGVKLQSCITLHVSSNPTGAATLQGVAGDHSAVRVEWTTHPELVPRGYGGGLLVHDGALIDLDRLVMRLLQHPRISVRQNTEVTRLEQRGARTYALCRDATLSAGRVVLATNAYSGLLSPYLAESVRVVRGSVFASHPLRDGAAIKYVMPTIIDGGTLTVTPAREGRVRAAAWQHNGNGQLSDPYDALHGFLKRTDPHLIEQADYWRGSVTTVTDEGAPRVGRLLNDGNVLYALGLGLFGLAWAPVVAEQIARLAS